MWHLGKIQGEEIHRAVAKGLPLTLGERGTTAEVRAGEWLVQLRFAQDPVQQSRSEDNDGTVVWLGFGRWHIWGMPFQPLPDLSQSRIIMVLAPWFLVEMIQQGQSVKYLAQCLPHEKPSINLLVVTTVFPVRSGCLGPYHAWDDEGLQEEGHSLKGR
jgi:hypothetical protein